MYKLKLWIIKKIWNFLDLNTLENKVLQNRSEIDFHRGFLITGVDVQLKHPGSWAVVCIQGKPERVQFVNLKEADAEELKRFLRHFEKQNTIIDDPFYNMGRF